MNKIRILLADDHAVLRAGLKSLLSTQPDMAVVAEAGDSKETVSKSQELLPDIVLMDISMPGSDGLAATKEIKERNPATKVLILTMHEDEAYLRRAFRSGADGYVPKKAVDTELLAAIRATYRGEHFIHPSMTVGLISNLRREKETSQNNDRDKDILSQREKEVLRLLAMGHTSQEIATKLFLSVKTVESHKTRLKAKLGFRGRAELVRYAIQMGLMDTKA